MESNYTSDTIKCENDKEIAYVYFRLFSDCIQYKNMYKGKLKGKKIDCDFYYNFYKNFCKN